MVMVNENATAVVSVDGEDLSLAGGDTIEQIEEIARYLDGKIGFFRQMNPTMTRRQLLVLTGLNITEELFHLRREYAELINMIENEIK